MTEAADALGGPLLVFVGPTATGKSALAARVAAHLGGEVVSADSVQVYRYFDIGSGKPSEEELAMAPHHLIDIADPLEPIEASVWAELARQKITEIRARGAVPVVCGGTFLWVRALLFGLAAAPPGDANIRARHKEQAESQGRASLHEALARVDPASAARLHPNDLIRVSRALEVFEMTGTQLSALQESHGFRAPHYDARLLSIDWEKDEYEGRLRERVRDMLAQGFREEVRDLISRGYEKARAMDAVGYRQVREAVLGEEAVSDEDLLQRVTQVTRIFARRQRTWLRDEPQTKLKSSVLAEPDELLSFIEEVSSWVKSRG